MTMSQQRYNELDANGGTLTPAEQAEGWHYCPEFDFMLTMGEGPGPCPCGIHGDSPLQLTRPEPHGSRDTFVPPPDKTDEEMTAALIKNQIEADAYDANLAQEMKAEPAIYTEQEMKIVLDKLQDANERLETLRTDFNNYREMMHERGYNARNILFDIDRNVETARNLHLLCSNTETFMTGYNNARVSEVLQLLTEDNILKLKNLKESQS